MIFLIFLSICACTTANPAQDLYTLSPVSTAALTSLPTSISTFTPSPAPSLTPTKTQVPTPTVTSTATPLACWEAGGRIEIHRLYTDISPWPWEHRVYTPPCYEQQPDRRYPTLYLIHGSTFNDDQWDRLGADETADRLIAQGAAPPFIIVMPRDRVWLEPDQDPFGRALADHLIPWVDEHYRTNPDRQFRAIGGLSRGAAWAVHLGLSRWELFGAIGAHSLPVFWSDTPNVRRWLTSIPADTLPRIYLDIGERDYLIRSAVWFEGLLTEMGIPHEWYLFPGRHEEAYWQSHLESYLRWYTQDWEE